MNAGDSDLYSITGTGSYLSLRDMRAVPFLLIYSNNNELQIEYTFAPKTLTFVPRRDNIIIVLEYIFDQIIEDML